MKITKKRKRRAGKIHKRKKSNPFKGVKTMKRRKRRTHSIKRSKRYYKSNPANPRKRHHVKRRHKRNPGMLGGIGDLLVNGALAGVGAVGLLFVSDIIATKFLNAPATTADAGGKAKRNIVTIITALAGGWLLNKYMKGEKGKAIANGFVVGAIMRVVSNSLGMSLPLGEVDQVFSGMSFLGSNVDKTIDNLLGGVSMNGEELLGYEEMDGENMLLGFDGVSMNGADDILLGESDMLLGSDYDM